MVWVLDQMQTIVFVLGASGVKHCLTKAAPNVKLIYLGT